MTTNSARDACVTAFFILTVGIPGVKSVSRSARDIAASAPARHADRSCFLLYEVGVGDAARALDGVPDANLAAIDLEDPARAGIEIVQNLLLQPSGMIVNATGEHPFGGRWPEGTVLSAKTGSGRDRSGQEVRWLVGHVSRGHRSWVFVSCVIGTDRTASLAAADALHHERVL